MIAPEYNAREVSARDKDRGCELTASRIRCKALLEKIGLFTARNFVENFGIRKPFEL